MHARPGEEHADGAEVRGQKGSLNFKEVPGEEARGHPMQAAQAKKSGSTLDPSRPREARAQGKQGLLLQGMCSH